MLGLELEETRAIAVRVTGNGTVDARAKVDGNDLVAAVEQAMEQLSTPPGNRGSLGVATAVPDAKSVAAALVALAPTVSGVSGGELHAISSGTAAAVAEAWIGAARGARDVAFFAVADHAIAGLVRDGSAVTGRRGRAASVAWLALNPVEREDYRRTGCLEAEVAAPGIVRRLVWRIKAGDRSRLQDTIGNELTAITIDHVLDAAREGDGVAVSVVRDTAKYLGMAAANLVAISDPEVLVLGGIMASATDLLLEPVRTEIARRLPRPMMDALTIAPAALGPEASAIGAARLASPPLP